MRKILGFIAVLGASSAFSPMVIAHKANVNPYKEELEKLIRKVEEIVAKPPIRENQEFKTLRNTLLSAKDTHWRGSATTEDYIEIINRLKDDLYDYQTPGYKKAKDRLKNLVATAEQTILDNHDEDKSPEVLDNLVKEIAEAKVALETATEHMQIKIATDKLQFRLTEYNKWNWNDHKPS